ncbi:hypothetical protein SLEP1_g12428 [Rubroshorea leprosula]|uniref:Uncharacterized protein n=1 Tax=Rubroshorea leprosula TaxID=152421 RepID=A0AAV5IIC0_9ROSI|nr:hypothetical protein SLEP1_g12428 [Rubroshorea leprosula]
MNHLNPQARATSDDSDYLQPALSSPPPIFWLLMTRNPQGSPLKLPLIHRGTKQKDATPRPSSSVHPRGQGCSEGEGNDKWKYEGLARGPWELLIWTLASGSPQQHGCWKIKPGIAHCQGPIS